MKKFLATILFSLFLFPISLITGCSSDKPAPTPKPAQNKIDLSNARFTGYDLFGNVKGEDYGSLTGKDSADYKKAQVAVNAIKVYPAQLVETQDLSKVDAISGASISYGQFVETTKRAIEEASK